MRLKHLINKEKFNKESKGFTLIEIIVAIVLISVIGVSSVVGVNYAKKVSEEKKIDKTYSQFDEALDVYLSNHPEIYENLESNVEGAVVTLELLKNEGLVTENVINPETNEPIDYENSYYVLSDAVMLSEEAEEDVCDGQVSLNVLKSWKTLKDKVETSDIIYICPKDSSDEDGTSSDEYEERIRRLEEQISRINIGSGEKNYVLFDVNSDTTKKTYWPETNTDLWRVLSNKTGELKLVYTQSVGTNNELELKPIIDKSKEYNFDNDSKTYYYYVTGSGNYSKLNYTRLTGKYYGVDSSSYSSSYSQYPNYNWNLSDSIYVENTNTLYSSKRSIYYSTYSSYNSSNKIDSKCGSTITCYFYNYSINYNDFSTSGIIFRKPTLYTSSSGLYMNYRYGSSGWIVEDLFNGNYNYLKEGSKRNVLYNAINANLRGYMNEGTIKTGNFKDKLLVISEEETKKDWLSNKSFVVGISSGYDPTYDFYSLFLVSNGGQVSEQTGIIKKRDSEYQCKRVDCYMYITIPFIPVISLNMNNAKLLINIEEYNERYINKYNCTADNLGTEVCPMLIKFSDIYSDGTTNGTGSN